MNNMFFKGDLFIFFKGDLFQFWECCFASVFCYTFFFFEESTFGLDAVIFLGIFDSGLSIFRWWSEGSEKMVGEAMATQLTGLLYS